LHVLNQDFFKCFFPLDWTVLGFKKPVTEITCPVMLIEMSSIKKKNLYHSTDTFFKLF